MGSVFSRGGGGHVLKLVNVDSLLLVTVCNVHDITDSDTEKMFVIKEKSENCNLKLFC